jgi:hypothetical protein
VWCSTIFSVYQPRHDGTKQQRCATFSVFTAIDPDDADEEALGKITFGLNHDAGNLPRKF